MAETEKSDSAMHMLREVVNGSPQSQWLPDAVLGLCKGYDELKHRRGVVAWCGHFVEHYPRHVNVGEAAERLERCRIALDLV